MKLKKLSIQGMGQEKDAERVKEALLDVWGVRHVEISLPRAEATVSYHSESASEVDLERAIIDQGYDINEEANDGQQNL